MVWYYLFIKITVGSQNQNKLTAVQNAVALYPQLFPAAEVVGLEVAVEEFGHPKNLDETVAGAVARARAAFSEGDISVGIEGGLMAVPQTKSGYMEVNVCALFDGERVVIGLSSAFEWPKRVNELVLANQADASQAFLRLGLTNEPKLGATPGGITSWLTAGRITREQTIEQAFIMAAIQLEKPQLY